MLNLAEIGGLSNGFSATIDNLFTFFPLLEELLKRGIGGQVFISLNCLENTAVFIKTNNGES